jgi:hypothetical protein
MNAHLQPTILMLNSPEPGFNHRADQHTSHCRRPYKGREPDTHAAGANTGPAFPITIVDME